MFQACGNVFDTPGRLEKVYNSTAQFYAEIVKRGEAPYQNCDLTVIAFTKSNKQMPIPIMCKWFKELDNIAYPQTQITSNTYLVSPFDVGYKIRIQVTSLEEGQMGYQELTYGPVQIDINIRRRVEDQISAGLAKFVIQVFKEEKSFIKDVFLDLNGKDNVLKFCLGGKTLLIPFSLENPQSSLIYNETTKIKMIFKNVNDFEKLCQFIGLSQNVDDPSIGLCFPTRANRDIFLFVNRYFQIKNHLNISIGLQQADNLNKQQQLTLDVSQELASYKKELYQILDKFTGTLTEKENLKKEVKRLEEEFQQINIFYKNLIEKGEVKGIYSQQLQQQLSFVQPPPSRERSSRLPIFQQTQQQEIPNKELLQKIDDLQVKCQELEKQNMSLLNTKEELLLMRDEYENNKRVIQDSLSDQLKHKLRAEGLEREVSIMKQQVENIRQNERAVFEKKEECLKQEIQQLEETCEQNSKLIAALRLEVQDYRDRCGSLQENKVNLEIQIQEHKEIIRKIQEENDQVTLQKGLTIRQSNNFQQNNMTLDLEFGYNTLRKERQVGGGVGENTFREDISSFALDDTFQEEENSRRLRDLIDQVDILKLELIDSQKRSDAMDELVHSITNELQNVKRELVVEISKNQQLKDELEKSRLKLLDQQNNHNVQEMLNELQLENFKLQDELGQARVQLSKQDDLTQKVAQYRTTLKKALEETNILKLNNKQLLKQNNQLELSQHGIQQVNMSFKDELNEVTKKFFEQQNEIMQKNQEIERLKNILNENQVQSSELLKNFECIKTSETELQQENEILLAEKKSLENIVKGLYEETNTYQNIVQNSSSNINKSKLLQSQQSNQKGIVTQKVKQVVYETQFNKIQKILSNLKNELQIFKQNTSEQHLNWITEQKIKIEESLSKEIQSYKERINQTQQPSDNVVSKQQMKFVSLLEDIIQQNKIQVYISVNLDKEQIIQSQSKYINEYIKDCVMQINILQNNLKQQEEKFQNEIQKPKEALEQYKQNTEGQINVLKDNIISKDTEYQKLYLKLENLQNQVITYQERYQDQQALQAEYKLNMNQQINLKTEENNKLMKQLTEKQEQINQLQELNKVKEQQVYNSGNKIQEQIKIIERLSSNVNDMNLQIESLRESLTLKIKKLEQENVQLKDIRNSIEQQLNMSKLQLVQQQQDIHEIQEKYVNLENANQQQKDKYEKIIEEYKQSKEATNKEINSLLKDNAIFQIGISELQGELDNHMQKCNVLEQEYNKLMSIYEEQKQIEIQYQQSMENNEIKMQTEKELRYRVESEFEKYKNEQNIQNVKYQQDSIALQNSIKDKENYVNILQQKCRDYEELMSSQGQETQEAQDKFKKYMQQTEELEIEKNELKKKIQEIQQQNDNYSDNIKCQNQKLLLIEDKYNKEINQLKDQKAEIDAINKQKEELIVNFHNQLQEKSKEIKRCQDIIETLKDNLKQNQQKTQKNENELNNQISQLETKNKQLGEQQMQYQNDIQVLQDKITEQGNVISQFKKDYRLIELQREELNQQVIQVQREYQDLLKQYNDTQSELLNETNDKIHKINQYKTEINTLNSSIRQLKSQINEKNNLLNEEQVNTQKIKKSLQDEIKQEIQKVQVLEQQLNELKQQQNILEEKRSQQLSEAQLNIQELQQQNEQYIQQQKQLQEQIEQIKQEKQVLQQQNEQMVNELRNIKQQNEVIKDKMNMLNQVNTEVSNDNIIYQQKIDILVNQIQEIQLECDQVTAQRNEISERLQQLNIQYQQASANLIKENQELQQQIIIDQDQCKQVEKGYKEQINELSSNIENKISENYELVQQLQEIKGSKQRSQQIIQEQSEEISKLYKNIEEQENQLEETKLNYEEKLGQIQQGLKENEFALENLKKQNERLLKENMKLQDSQLQKQNKNEQVNNSNIDSSYDSMSSSRLEIENELIVVKDRIRELELELEGVKFENQKLLLQLDSLRQLKTKNI